jgi:hypothetical protein
MNAKPTTSSEQNSGKDSCKKSFNLLADVGVTQPLTTETRNQDDAFLNGSNQPASHFHPGPYPSTQSRVVQFNSEPATGDAGPSVVKFSQARIHTMIINTKISPKAGASPLLAEGIYPAVVKAIIPGKPEETTGEVSDLQIEFTLKDGAACLARKYPAKLDGRSPLRRDTQAVLGRHLSTQEMASFDTGTLVSRSCRVVVVHQAEGGSKPKARIKTVLGAELTPSVPVAA